MNTKEACKEGKRFLKENRLNNPGFRARYNDLRYRIEELDVLISLEKDDKTKLEYINESIEKNCLYIYLLRRRIPVKVVFCVILSLALLLGLIIFLPGIIVRKKKINICVQRINKLKIQQSIISNQIKNNN